MVTEKQNQTWTCEVFSQAATEVTKGNETKLMETQSSQST